MTSPVSLLPPCPSPPLIWTLAGGDPDGGAGLQADLKTIQALGGHGAGTLTTHIAQNTRAVRRLWPVAPEILGTELDALLEEGPPDAVKVGAVPGRAQADVIARVLGRLSEVPVIWDPVQGASSGEAFRSDSEAADIARSLQPVVSVITPNLTEARALCRAFGLSPDGGPMDLACALRDAGFASVLVKGGHAAEEGHAVHDAWAAPDRTGFLSLPRLPAADVHGTGCFLSTALAALLGRGVAPEDAQVAARAALQQNLRGAAMIASGVRPMLPFASFAPDPDDWPLWSDAPWPASGFPAFPRMDLDRPGVHPIVDRASEVARLAPHGLRWIQIRIKDPSGTDLDAEIAAALTACRTHGVRLIVNDHWEAALRHPGVWGVHLGQDDLAPDAIVAIAAAGLRLGLSTHSWFEIARARTVRPSYIAIGTIHQTTSKVMTWTPLGVDGFARLRHTVPDIPVVGIGGLTLENAPPLLAHRPAGLAVISALRDSPHPERDIPAWNRLWADPEPGTR